MISDANGMDRLARAQELRRRGELARCHDGAMVRLCYEEAVVLFRELDEPLVLAHTIRHLGDVYLEQGRPDLAEPCYHEALGLYRRHEADSSLVVCPVYNFTDQPPSFSPWAGWIRV